ncbi:MAG: DUF4177 domain-containing protein [Candidatus Aminicenantes bacterium]|nr:DUF4177 domain-containing protein [Candidatus Aminicenantes bacterium]
MEWEYNTVLVLESNFFGVKDEVNKILNEQGEKGWELVSATIIASDHHKLLLILKRPRE